MWVAPSNLRKACGYSSVKRIPIASTLGKSLCFYGLLCISMSDPSRYHLEAVK